MSKQKQTDLKTMAWINLILGSYNLYLFTIGGLLFNLIIGVLNVGVWVFFRKPNFVSEISSSEIRK